MTLLIFHYRPKRLYPPLLNLITYLEEENVTYKLISSLNYRTAKSSGFGKLFSIFDYFIYTIRCINALRIEPKNILYVESISATPLAIYLKIFGLKRMRVFVHYHEYFSEDEYKEQSFFERLGRKFELPLLKAAKWISHNNKDRLRLFKIDFPTIDALKFNIMPNYPSKFWLSSHLETQPNEKAKSSEVIRILHIGSLSFDTMYLNEVLNHFGNNAKFEITFYSHLTDQNVINKLKVYVNVKFMGSIKYEDIPKLKGRFDVGLVIYKGIFLNVVYSAPNKIFEYLGLDLDVWCSDKIVTAREYQITSSYPKMLMMDFENLSRFDFQHALDKSGIMYKPSPYFSEAVYAPLVYLLNK